MNMGIVAADVSSAGLLERQRQPVLNAGRRDVGRYTSRASG